MDWKYIILFVAIISSSYAAPNPTLNLRLFWKAVLSSSKTISNYGNHGLRTYIQTRDSSVCYDDLGCIVIDDSWFDPVNRPFNLLPLPREKINTKFILHTREFPTHDTMLYANDLDSIRNSHFNASRPTKFIVHGFIDDGTVRWIKELTNNLLQHGDYNVITVNWGGGSLPLYTQATANTRLVGLEIAHMVNTMVEHLGVNPEDVHLIGHSLGAHTCGYAGEKIPNLGRITGLDPAEPYFQWLPEHIRLDPSDAKFVDVIHTDTRTILLLGYGMIQPVGHLDFYPNGGRQQPGCNLVDIPLDAITEDMITSVRELAACNHLRSINFFTDSLLPRCQFVGYECPDNDAFHRGECYSCGADNRNCSRFGLEATSYPSQDRNNVILYLDTGSDAPYCKYHYHVKLSLAKPSEAEDRVYGKLKVSIYGTLNQIVDINLTPDGSIWLNHGQEHVFLYVGSIDVGRIQRVEVHWKYDGTILDPGTICGLFCNNHMYLNNIEISELDHYPETNRLDHTYKNCPVGSNYADIDSNNQADFYPTACT